MNLWLVTHITCVQRGGIRATHVCTQGVDKMLLNPQAKSVLYNYTVFTETLAHAVLICCTHLGFPTPVVHSTGTRVAPLT
jgi:hypothetical protein